MAKQAKSEKASQRARVALDGYIGVKVSSAVKASIERIADETLPGDPGAVSNWLRQLFNRTIAEHEAKKQAAFDAELDKK